MNDKEAWATYKKMLLAGEINDDTFALITADLKVGN